MLSLFYKFPQTFVRCFSGRNLLWHIIAITLTALLVFTGFDWIYFQVSRSPFTIYLVFPALVLGGLLPILVPLGMLAWGKLRRDARIINTGWALGQAAILGSLISSLYKSLTGRIPPELFNSVALVDLSHQFQFGFLRGGIFWGWPSSHTTIAFAMASTLLLLYPTNKSLRYGSLFYAFYVGLSVSVSVHWLSEFVAGAIIGTVIGAIVGKVFIERYRSTLGLS